MISTLELWVWALDFECIGLGIDIPDSYADEDYEFTYPRTYNLVMNTYK
jgi:hypothetical protein